MIIPKVDWTINKPPAIHMAGTESQNSLESEITMHIHFKLQTQEVRWTPLTCQIQFYEKEAYLKVG